VILGHVKCQHLGKKCWNDFDKFKKKLWPNCVFFSRVPLGSCAILLHLKMTCMLMKRSFKFVENLMFMWEITWSKSTYAKCANIQDACRTFNEMPSQNMVTLNVMIFGSVKCNQRCKALELF